MVFGRFDRAEPNLGGDWFVVTPTLEVSFFSVFGSKIVGYRH